MWSGNLERSPLRATPISAKKIGRLQGLTLFSGKLTLGTPWPRLYARFAVFSGHSGYTAKPDIGQEPSLTIDAVKGRNLH